MDKRQQKTRAAIYMAYSKLLEKKSFQSITIQNIIDEANIGRSTFYSHFETKDDLTKSMCNELFEHIVTSAMDNKHDAHGLYTCKDVPASPFLHILRHLLENDHNILTLLSCEGNDLFLHYFKLSMNNLVKRQYFGEDRITNGVPDEFLINHISGSFVEMVRWWASGHRDVTPEELDFYFKSVIEPIL